MLKTSLGSLGRHHLSFPPGERKKGNVSTFGQSGRMSKNKQIIKHTFFLLTVNKKK